MRSVAEDSQGLPGIPLAGSRSIIEPCYRDGNNYEPFVLSALRQAQGERGLGYGGLVAGNGRAPVRGEPVTVRGELVAVRGELVEPRVTLRQAQGERGLGYGELVAVRGELAPVRGEPVPVGGEPVPVGGEPVEPNVAREY